MRTEDPRAAHRRALDDMPVEYRDRFAALLLDRAAVAPAVLEGELAEYMSAVRQLAALTHLDLGAAERIGETLRALIRAPGAGDAGARRLVQAAVRYFVREDEDDEITGVLAFDDDVQVLNAVCRALGRADLVIPFTPPSTE